ncbi:MAG: hypothetical protein HW421_2303 [Ignavibacteria bacterium]|nr:hypothetical protein [Ignavibacteria bacterium]
MNSESIEDIDIAKIKKDNIDNSLFFSYIFEKQKEIRFEVDKYLLQNLILLKEELRKFYTSDDNVHNLILRCLFVKYIEDRQIIDKNILVDALKTNDSGNLESCFNKVKIINGDIFKDNIVFDIRHIKELHLFFTTDYKISKTTHQENLFYPYKFDKIPIQLISHVYEQFIGDKEKNRTGVYYTRTFVVDFMLSHTIYPKLKEKPEATILDPACGSGIFLVQSFKKILLNQKDKNLTIDEKANILTNQIFGIDFDLGALRIAAFSLYLSLLENTEIWEIKKQIENKQPILPPLIGINLLENNTIADEIVFKVYDKQIETFDCIFGNPPWKQLDKDEVDKRLKETRKAINKQRGKNEIYENVSRYQLSQAFLFKIFKWCNNETKIAFIVNNSNFLNQQSFKFRVELLEKYRIQYFYELSDISEILFENAKEPCAVLIMDRQSIDSNEIEYITPKLTKFSKNFRLIHYTSKDIKKVKQDDLKKEDVLWRIFVNGNWQDYQLIKKIFFNKDDSIIINVCSRGINPKGGGKSLNPKIVKRLDAKYLEQYYYQEDSLIEFDYNQDFERSRIENYNDLFLGDRLLIKRMPSTRDNLRLTCTFENKEIVYFEHIIVVKINKSKLLTPLLTLMNSSLIGYYFSLISSQTNKGKGKQAVKVEEIKELPFIIPTESNKSHLSEFVELIKHKKSINQPTSEIEKEIDELIYNIYNLLEFEKEIIKEFYQINVEMKGKDVQPEDIQDYANKFREVFYLMSKPDLKLNASYHISENIGAIINFKIVNHDKYIKEIQKNDYDKKILRYVKDKNLQQEMLEKRLNEDKVKIYDGNEFFIIKSKYIKDWTIRQAINDANEEIKEIIKKQF